jgi:hypothetical protein
VVLGDTPERAVVGEAILVDAGLELAEQAVAAAVARQALALTLVPLEPEHLEVAVA